MTIALHDFVLGDSAQEVPNISDVSGGKFNESVLSTSEVNCFYIEHINI